MVVNKMLAKRAVPTLHKRILAVSALLISFGLVQGKSHAMEGVLQLHKGSESGTQGYTLGVTDSIFRHKAFNWSLTYNLLDDVNVDWNNDSLDFSLDTIEASLSYRYSPKSYNDFVKGLTIEAQAGIGIAMTENKFVWPSLDEEKFFSEKGDINPFIAFTVYKKLTKQASVHLGVKHYPSYSEFGDISSAFIGFNYRFGRQFGY